MAGGSASREERTLGTWKLPIRGVIQGLDDLSIPPDALYSASNVEIVDGTLRGRRGLTVQHAQAFGARPMGALNFWQSTTAGWIVMATTAKVWTYEIAAAAWTDRAGSLTASADDATRVFEFGFGTPFTNRAYICNGKDTLKVWAPGDSTATTVGGSPPIYRDACILGDRIVGLVGTHAVQWGEILVDNDWPAANTRYLTETASPTIAIQLLGNLGVAVYKRDGAWLGELTGLAGASAIRFIPLFRVDGPAGPNALVDVPGVGEHIYMTRSGRVARFNGASHSWIAEGTWAVVKAEIDQTKPNRVHGVYMPQEHQVWFTYKRTGQTDTDGLLVVQLARKERNTPYAAFPGRWMKSVTASCKLEDDTFQTAMVFTDNSAAEKSYRVEGVNDAGTAISSNIQHGLVPAPELESLRVLSIEPFLERLAGHGTLTIKAVTSNVLSVIGGTLSTGVTVDLTTTPIKEFVGVNARGRFLAPRLEWTSTATVRYRGIVLRVPQG